MNNFYLRKAPARPASWRWLARVRRAGRVRVARLACGASPPAPRLSLVSLASPRCPRLVALASLPSPRCPRLAALASPHIDRLRHLPPPPRPRHETVTVRKNLMNYLRRTRHSRALGLMNYHRRVTELGSCAVVPCIVIKIEGGTFKISTAQLHNLKFGTWRQDPSTAGLWLSG